MGLRLLEELKCQEYNNFVKRFFFLFICVLYLVIPTSPSDNQKNLFNNLDRRFRKWLQEEVVYIITPKEKDVFLRLDSDRERDMFIEAFWKARDPIPNTPKNEFKEEHYARIQYANNWFGKDSPSPGWRTDMGRIYITLGPPRQIQNFENMTEVYPIIIWFYEGMVEYGLPNAFNVAFFKRGGMGEYELYSPVKFGPQQLLIHYSGDMTDYLSAYGQLLNIEPAIAEVSLTLIPGESFFTPSPSMASEILIRSKIPSAPFEKVKDTYAEKLLAYKDIVEVDYTANYIDSDSMVTVFENKSGMFFVHYLIEPKRLTFEKLGGRYIANLEINGKVSDLEGKTVYQFERAIPIEFSDDQMDKIKAKLFSYQDLFPLVGGRYTFNSLVKNTVSKEFTSVEAEITVPESPSLRMSPLILANKIDRDSQYKEKNKPFLFADVQLVASPRNDFTSEDTLYLYFQIQGMTEDLREKGILEVSILKENEKVQTRIKSVREYSDAKNFLEEFPLTNFSPAHYTVNVSLLDQNKQEVLSEKSLFYITALPSLPRPWILSLPLPPSSDPVYNNILGIQYFNKKDIEKASLFLEEAYRRNPGSPKFAIDFCRVLFLAKDYRGVKQVALPFLQEKTKYEFLQLVGQSSQALGEFQEAISYYKEYLTHFGTNIAVLNSVGECYYRLGNTDEALVAWEKSLEIDPHQERLQSLVKSIKEKNEK